MEGKITSGIVLMLLLANVSTLTYVAVGIAGASPQAYIYVNPKGTVADIGDSFTIDINIQDVLDLFQYNGRLRFNKNILEATSIEEGPFLKEGTTSPSGTFFEASVDSIGVHVNCVTIGSYPGVDGDGTLFTVTFTVKAAGFTTLNPESFWLYDSTSTEIMYGGANGSFSTTHTRIFIDSPSVVDPTLTPGSTFTVDVKVSDVEYLYDWAANLTFNPDVLRVTEVIEGDFLKVYPDGTGFGGVIETDWAAFGSTMWGIHLGVSGSGTLATVEFEVLGIGESLIEFVLTDEWFGSTYLENQRSPNPPPNFDEIPFIAENGYFSNLAVVVSSTLDIRPDTLNLGSSGRWTTAYVELPEAYDIYDIDVSSIMLNHTIPAGTEPVAFGDFDNDGIPDLMVKFDRASLASWIYQTVGMQNKVSLTLTGELTDGTRFEGTDIIFVVYVGGGSGRRK